MPNMPLELSRRVDRFSEQRWVLDAIIRLMGVEWDQGRLGYTAAACGHDSQGDFIGLRPLIKNYNDISREFMKAARRRELRALNELRQGHPATARESFFTASLLYGMAQWPICGNTPLNLELDKKKTTCFLEFIKLAGRRIERVELSLGAQQVPAYLHFPPGYSGGKVPCVVTVSGMDGYKELSVAMDGDRWLTRGFAVLAIDGPGQGEALCREVWYDPDTYGQLGPVAFDYLAGRPEFDPARIVAHGVSFGSYWATQLAAAEPRFAACAVVLTCFEPHGFSLFETASPSFKLRFMYMTNVQDEARFEAVTRRIDALPLASAIKCPFMVAGGEDDALSDARHTFEFVNRLSVPKTLAFYEGEDHGMHGSRSGQLGPEAFTLVADWLYDRVNGRELRSSYLEVDSAGEVHTSDWGTERHYVYGITESLRQRVFGK